MRARFDEYRRLRDLSIALTTQIFQELTKDQIRIAARMLDLLKNNTLRLDHEQAMDQFADFVINDCYDEHQQNAVMRYLNHHRPDLDARQRDILNAFIAARCSLFEIREARPGAHLLILRDLLNGGEEIALTEGGLSASPVATRFLLFTRLLRLDGDHLTMTSGAPLLFEKAKQAHLLKKYPSKAAKVLTCHENTRLAVAFFKLNRSDGYRQLAYRTVQDGIGRPTPAERP